MKKFDELTRTHYNTWPFKIQGRAIEFPVTVKLKSINDDEIEIYNILNTKEVISEASSNFPGPSNTLFDIETLKKQENVPNDKIEQCCSLDSYDYTHIYHDNIAQGVYKLWGNLDVTLNHKTNPYKGESCVKVNYKKWEVLQFGSNIPARADQYTHLHFMVKAEETCENCLLLKSVKVESKGMKLSIPEANKWIEHSILLKDLNVTNEFYGFWCQNYGDKSKTMYFDEIYLIKATNPPDASKCWQGVGGKSGNGCSLNYILIVLIMMIFLI